MIPGESVPAPAAPSATGFTFEGWFASSAHADVFDFTAPLASGETTAYAVWSATGGGDSGDSNEGESGTELASTGSDTAQLALTGGVALTLASLGLLLVRRRSVKS